MADSEKGDVTDKEKQTSQEEEKDKDTSNKGSPPPSKSPTGSKSGSAKSTKSAASGKKSPAGKKSPDAKSAKSSSRASSPKGKSSRRGTPDAESDGSRRSRQEEEKKEPPLADGTGLPETLPEGVEPLFLATKSQEIYECVVDEQVTEANPYKLVKIEDIKKDFFNRAAVCDFHPYKALIESYPADEILIAYDADFKYGQNFLIATTEEAKQQLLAPPKPEGEEGKEAAEEEEEEVIYKYVPPEPKDWISLGSEREIEEESIRETRPRIKLVAKRIRREFGAPVEFKDRNVGDAKDGYIECTAYNDTSFELKKIELDKATQAIPELMEGSAQTEWKYPRNACTQYAPREFTEDEKEEVYGSKNLVNFMNSVLPRFELALQQNEIMNVFFDDWLNLSGGDSTFGAKADTHLKEFQSFTDLHFSKEKTITCIDWHPTIRGVVAVSVAERMSFDDRIDNAPKVIMTPSLILIWSFTDPIHPQLLLEAPDDIGCFKFSPSDPNIVAGGCVNGQVVLWDISAHADKLKTSRSSTKKKNLNTLIGHKPGFEDDSAMEIPIVRYCAVSSIEHSHRGPVTDVQWVPDHMELNRMGVPQENKSQNCVQVMTCAIDHCVLVWDTRPSKGPQTHSKKHEEHNPMGVPTTFKHLDLSWKPHLKVCLEPPPPPPDQEVSLFKSEPGGDHSPTKFSIAELQGDRSISTSGDQVNQLTDKQEKQETTGFTFGVGKPGSAGTKRTLQNVKTHFYVGTEDGEIVYVDWMPQKDQDTGKIQTAKPDYYHSLHDGPVVTVQRSPFFRDIVLVIGGWTFSVWKEGVSSGPILTSSACSKRLTAGFWSPSRPAVFYIARQDGSVDIWDLLDRTHEASMNQNVSAAPITYIYPYQVTNKQHLLAVGDSAGTLHILEIPWSLRQPTANEHTGMANYFEREVKRRAFVVARWDFRELEKRELEQEAKRKAGIAPQVQLSEEEMEYRMKMEYESYLSDEAQFLRDLGLKDDADEPLPSTD